ncbi:hypothetical protein OKA05_25865 [Luteolibacter arcticus]|uniref:Uncharacterized protein n=1 Tax=Luteolibacter arcticus TaxID=1581411 RepID=A0ABT3GR76_9BACT|nr:hypothetical protein [Luteolibacter arcticus]MCW1926012.1 hypothetical protein [Luteolibacter arcticus]
MLIISATRTLIFGIVFSIYSFMGESRAESLQEKINYDNFSLARKDFSDRQGGMPYISGGKEIVNKDSDRAMSDADIGVLAIYLFERGNVGEREFFMGLLSDNKIVRCASCYVMKHKYGHSEDIPPFRYEDDPLSDANWKNIEFWRTRILEQRPREVSK